MAEGEIVHHRIAYEEPLIAELKAFVRAIVDGTSSPVPLHEGLDALSLAEVMLRSAAQGQAIELGKYHIVP